MARLWSLRVGSIRRGPSHWLHITISRGGFYLFQSQGHTTDQFSQTLWVVPGVNAFILFKSSLGDSPVPPRDWGVFKSTPNAQRAAFYLTPPQSLGAECSPWKPTVKTCHYSHSIHSPANRSSRIRKNIVQSTAWDLQ